MKVRVKIPAKINLTLDVVGVKNGYHELNSLVASVNIFDAFTLVKRKDCAVNVTFTGLSADVEGKDSIACRAAELFVKEFGTTGADITIKRNIPAGGGLGGSSADAAGVLVGMQKLYSVHKDMSGLANMLGSDTAYMLRGGYALLKGRGDIVCPLSGINRRLYILCVKGTRGVSAGECYKRFDDMRKSFPSVTEGAAKLLGGGAVRDFLHILKNDLFLPATEILPEIEESFIDLKNCGAAVMTGSGSTVIGVYIKAKERNAAYKKLRAKYGDRLIKAKTL